VTLVIDLDAVADVEAAYLWYMRRDPLIAAKFRAAFNAAVARAVEQPESYEVLYRGARRVILHRFRTAFSTVSKARPSWSSRACT
jgi:plasmid stabilization system protein ParE